LVPKRIGTPPLGVIEITPMHPRSIRHHMTGSLTLLEYRNRYEDASNGEEIYGDDAAL
jgi:hypothetical protein